MIRVLDLETLIGVKAAAGRARDKLVLPICSRCATVWIEVDSRRPHGAWNWRGRATRVRHRGIIGDSCKARDLESLRAA